MKIKKYIFLIFFLTILNYCDLYSQMTWNQACSFTGASSSYIAVPNSASLNITGDFTIEGWVKPSNVTGAQIILQKRAGGANGYTLYLSSGKVTIRTGSVTRLIGKTIIPVNEWTHIAGSYKLSTNLFSVFVNGVQDTTVTIAGAAPITNTDSLFIGVGSNSPFNGVMDEIKIWNTGFTASDVTQVMRLSLGTNSGYYSALVASYTFQNSNPSGSLFTLNDQSGNNNNGFNRGVTAVNLSNAPGNTISINECIDLDGNGDFLSGPDHPNVSPVNGITVEAWVYPYSFNVNTNILSTIVQKGNSAGTVTDYRMAVNRQKFNFFVNETLIFQLNTSGEFFPLNKWTHVAFTYSGADGFTKFMLNGKLRWDDTNFVGNIHDNTDSLYLGGTADLQCFAGLIDELRITSSSLDYGVIGNQVFTSINESNDVAFTNVVYNFDGGLVSNTDPGPRLFLRGGARFSQNSNFSNTPVSPLSNSTSLNFQKGFYMNSPDLRIPSSGTSGFMISDTLDIPLSEVISDINVFVALNHTDEDNLVLSLISPAGTALTLYSTTSLINNSDNITTIFDDQADSSLTSNRYVMYAPKIKPLNNLNNAFAGVNTSGKWKLRIQDVAVNDTGRLIGWGIQFNNQVKKKGILSLTALIQGFYNPVNNLMTQDTMQVFIRNTISPYAKFDSAKAKLSDSGTANFIFNNVPDGVPVYIQLKHRNSIETWSRYSPFSFAILFEDYFLPFTSFLKYDFTLSTSFAHGGNIVLVDTGPSKFAIYSGDVNQDETIDGSDLSQVENDAENSLSGYVQSDVTGDDFTDASDLSIIINNAALGVNAVIP